MIQTNEVDFETHQSNLNQMKVNNYTRGVEDEDMTNCPCVYCSFNRRYIGTNVTQLSEKTYRNKQKDKSPARSYFVILGLKEIHVFTEDERVNRMISCGYYDMERNRFYVKMRMPVKAASFWQWFSKLINLKFKVVEWKEEKKSLDKMKTQLGFQKYVSTWIGNEIDTLSEDDYNGIRRESKQLVEHLHERDYSKYFYNEITSDSLSDDQKNKVKERKQKKIKKSTMGERKKKVDFYNVCQIGRKRPFSIFNDDHSDSGLRERLNGYEDEIELPTPRKQLKVMSSSFLEPEGVIHKKRVLPFNDARFVDLLPQCYQFFRGLPQIVTKEEILTRIRKQEFPFHLEGRLVSYVSSYFEDLLRFYVSPSEFVYMINPVEDEKIIWKIPKTDLTRQEPEQFNNFDKGNFQLSGIDSQVSHNGLLKFRVKDLKGMMWNLEMPSSESIQSLYDYVYKECKPELKEEDLGLIYARKQLNRVVDQTLLDLDVRNGSIIYIVKRRV